MGKITEIKECRNKERVNIYIDGEFALAVEKFVAYQNSLKVGSEITLERLAEISLCEEREVALKKAIAYTSTYRVTERKARDYLKGKEYNAVVIEETMEKLKKYNFVQDEVYAKDFVSAGQKSKGGKLLKMQLKEKGVSAEIVDGIEIDPDAERQACKKQAEKYMKNKERNFENFGKCFQNMARKGFDYSVIKEVVQELKGEVEIEDWV